MGYVQNKLLMSSFEMTWWLKSMSSYDDIFFLNFVHNILNKAPNYGAFETIFIFFVSSNKKTFCDIFFFFCKNYIFWTFLERKKKLNKFKIFDFLRFFEKMTFMTFLMMMMIMMMTIHHHCHHNHHQ